jgi:hypothetical protein
MQKKGVCVMLKMNKLMWIVLIFSLYFSASLFLGTSSFADPQGERIVRDYGDRSGVNHRVLHQPYLDIEVWVDKGEGATYYPGEKIKVYFKASRDCYVVLYNIDTKGYVSLLYPNDRSDDCYVEGGRTYRIPDRLDDYDLTVDGPEGTEYIQAVASFDPIALPNFPGLSEEYGSDEEIYAYRLDEEDPFEFMETINGEIVSNDYASDVCIFNVEYEHPRWYYWPQEVYVDRPVDVACGGVYFDYPWGVEVWIDGVFYGITPITIPYLVIGRHWVTFWYSGCWLWRDWVWVREGCMDRVWTHCDHRYRYVKDRFVEKSYRDEKANRRRGVAEERGFVKRLTLDENRRLTRVEKTRTYGNPRELKNESRTIEKREVTKYRRETPQSIERRQGEKKPNSQFRGAEKVRIIKSTKERTQIREKSRIEEKDRASKAKPRSSEVKPAQRQETKREPAIIKRSEAPRAQTRSTGVQKTQGRRR